MSARNPVRAGIPRASPARLLRFADLTQDNQTPAEIEDVDRRRFRAWPLVRGFWPGVVSMLLLVVVVYMARLDSLGDYEEVRAWMWALRGAPFQLAWLTCFVGCLPAYLLADKRDRVLTVLVNAPPLILLGPQLIYAL